MSKMWIWVVCVMKWYKTKDKLPPNAKMVLCDSKLWSSPLTCYQCGGVFYDMRGDLPSQPDVWRFL